MSLDEVTNAFVSRAPEFAGVKARVKFDLGADGLVLIDATETPPAVSNEDGEADCTIRVSLEDLQGMMRGQVNPTLAYTLGKLKVEGSMGLAMKLAALLDE